MILKGYWSTELKDFMEALSADDLKAPQSLDEPDKYKLIQDLRPQGQINYSEALSIKEITVNR